MCFFFVFLLLGPATLSSSRLSSLWLVTPDICMDIQELYLDVRET